MIHEKSWFHVCENKNFAAELKAKAMKSKIAVFYRTGEPLHLETCDIPALHPGEVLVKNEYATLCRSDISTYTGRRIEKSPTILGHEIVGRVVAVAPDEPAIDLDGHPLFAGERVTWAIYAADPEGTMARRGIPQKAPDLFKYGHERLTAENTLHGGLAEYTILRRHTPILPLSEEVPAPVAAIINCAVATVAGSLRLAGEVKGRRVVIRGAGMLGIVACTMCREQRAATIVAVDMDAGRLEVARRFGATTVCLTGEDYLAGTADISIDYSGVPSAMEATIADLAIGGTAVWVGGVAPRGNVTLNPETIVRRLLTVRGLHNYNTGDFRTAVEFISACHGRYPFHELIYDGFPLDRANEAFAYALTHNPFRVGVRSHSN